MANQIGNMKATKSQHSKAHEEFKKFLKLGKHRITPERFDVLDGALEYNGHFGADELYVKMMTEKKNVSRATIYNTLELLAQCDLLAKRNFGDNKTHYEASFNRKNHDHLVCVSCGEIHEFSAPEIEKTVEKVCEELGFENNGYSFTIFGKCKKNDCTQMKKNK
jgi:Fur family transcriptional regulator, ferric uptake regulator